MANVMCRFRDAAGKFLAAPEQPPPDRRLPADFPAQMAAGIESHYGQRSAEKLLQDIHAELVRQGAALDAALARLAPPERYEEDAE